MPKFVYCLSLCSVRVRLVFHVTQISELHVVRKVPLLALKALLDAHCVMVVRTMHFGPSWYTFVLHQSGGKS